MFISRSAGRILYRQLQISRPAAGTFCSIRAEGLPRQYRSFSHSPMMETPQQWDNLISFWFDRDDNDWFFAPDGLDDEIRAKYQHLVTQARSGQLDDWAEDAKGVLCLVVLLDQFPRNIFRGSAESFSSDKKALDLVKRAIIRGQDTQLGEMSKYYQILFYLPLQHAEDVMAQIAGVSLWQNVAYSCREGSAEKDLASRTAAFAKRHLDCIAQLGRFPKRNEALGRPTTEEEEQYLKDHPAGF